MQKGELWWAALQKPRGSEPGYRRPVAIAQSDDFTASRIETVIVASITSNTRLAFAPGNILLRRREAGLKQDSVINVTQLLTVNKFALTKRIGRLSPQRLEEFEAGLHLALAL
jgi:mRNA interferase MazF